MCKREDCEDVSYFNFRHFVIIPLLLLYYTMIGFAFYVISEWIQQRIERDMFANATNNPHSGCTATNHSDPDYIQYEQVQKRTAMFQLYNALAGSVPGFIAAVLLPSYSDSLGRRFFFIVCTSSFLIKMIVTSVTVYFDLSIWYVILGSVIDALPGSYYCFGVAATSYIADITRKGRERTIGITLLSAIHLISLLISSLVSGYVVKHGFFIPTVACTGVSLVTVVIALTVLPETLHEKHRVRRVSVLGTLRRNIEFYFSDTFKGSRGLYILLIAAFIFCELPVTHRSTLEVVYQLGMPFCWSPVRVGVFAAVKRATQGVAGLILIWPLQHWFSNISIAIWSTLFIAGSYVIEALAKTTWMLYLVPVVNTPEILPDPMLKGIMSSITPPEKQGSLFASLVTVEMACAVGASYLMTSVYSATVSFMNGFVFLVLAGMCGLDLILLIVLSSVMKTKNEGTSAVNSD